MPPSPSPSRRPGFKPCPSRACWTPTLPRRAKSSANSSASGRTYHSTLPTPTPMATSGSNWLDRFRSARPDFGTMPMPGWEKDSGWSEDLVPFDEMPHSVNPESGFRGYCQQPAIAHQDKAHSWESTGSTVTARHGSWRSWEQLTTGTSKPPHRHNSIPCPSRGAR